MRGMYVILCTTGWVWTAIALAYIACKRPPKTKNL